jgi:hypothetical protein
VTVTGLALGGLVGLIIVLAEVFLLRWLLADTAESGKSVILMTLWGAPLLAFGLAGRYFAQDGKAADAYSTYAGLAAATLILLLSARAARFRFDPVIEAEKDDVPQSDLSSLKWRAYVAISSLYSAAALSCVAFFMGTAPANDWDVGTRGSYLPLALLSAGFVITAAVLWSIRLVRRPDVRASLAALVCMAWATVMVLRLMAGYGGWVQLALAAPVSVIVGLFVAEGVISNAAYLHVLPVNRAVVAVAVSAGLASALTSAWMSGPAIESAAGLQRVGFSLWALALGAGVCVLLAFFAASVLPGSAPTNQYVIAKPLAGVLQDSFLVTLLSVSLSWMANFFLAHARNGVAVGAIAAYLALLSKAYVYAMGNNVSHVARERKRIADRAAANGREISNGEKQALNGLAKHIRRQNILAMGAVVAVFPIALLAIATEIPGFDREGIRQLLIPAGRS